MNTCKWTASYLLLFQPQPVLLSRSEGKAFLLLDQRRKISPLSPVEGTLFPVRESENIPGWLPPKDQVGQYFKDFPDSVTYTMLLTFQGHIDYLSSSHLLTSFESSRPDSVSLGLKRSN